MPELPDVEGFRRVLAEHGAGRRVREAKAPDSGVLRNTRPAALARALRGRRLQEPERRGKWLFVRTDGPTLLFHFGMSGELRWARRGEERHRHDRLILALDRGELRYRGQRELQGVWLAADGREAESVTGPLGPDALGLRRGEVRRRIERRRGRVKAALMDQELVAGLGNLLADEVLWQARIHPLRSVDELTEGEWGGLERALGRVVRESARAGRVPPEPSRLTGVRDRRGGTCPRCVTELEAGREGGRRFYACPSCQPRGPAG